MLTGKGLRTLFNLDVDAAATTVIVYSPTVTARLEYTCSFIFNHVLKVNYSLTDKPAELESSPNIKVNYSQQNLPQVVQIIPHPLLFETAVAAAKPAPVLKNGRLYFFENSQPGNIGLPFDLFSAVFYFISRYEEWQAVDKDAHQRFEAKASVLFQNGFHLKPVVDQWILEFKELLQQAYNLGLPQPAFKAMSSIDVDNLYAYRSKGLVRTAGACLKDLVKGDFKNLRERIKVVAGRAKDPFDVYEEVAAFCLEQQLPLFCFFLFRTGTAYDRTVNPRSPAFKKIIAGLKTYKAFVGLHPSYYASAEPAVLKREVKTFTAVLQEPVHLSRQHFLRFDIKTTPAQLLANGIAADFTMGFASSPGFRAGTAYPFFYYDFKAEKKSELLFVPFCAMDGAYTVYDHVTPEKTLAALMELAGEIKTTGGIFMTVFHERTFSNHLYPGFGPLYKNLHLKLKHINE